MTCPRSSHAYDPPPLPPPDEEEEDPLLLSSETERLAYLQLAPTPTED